MLIGTKCKLLSGTKGQKLINFSLDLKKKTTFNLGKSLEQQSQIYSPQTQLLKSPYGVL